jgi:acyl carrier protein
MTMAIFSDDGMDGVEMLQAIEAAFAIRISSEEATKIRRVGDLYDLI